MNTCAYALSKHANTLGKEKLFIIIHENKRWEAGPHASSQHGCRLLGLKLVSAFSVENRSKSCKELIHTGRDNKEYQ